MNKAQYNVSLRKALAFLKKNNLAKRIPLIPVNADNEFTKACQGKDYRKIYQIGIDANIYDVLLFDDSYFQFSFRKERNITTLRFAFFQFPYDIPSYNEYLTQNELDYSEIGEEFLEMYEQEVAEARLNSGSLMIRYDYSEELYRAGIHPVSHIHIGHSNDVRIPVSKVMTPMVFVLFVLKHIYLKRWKDLRELPTVITTLNNAKSNCSALNPTFFNNTDKMDLYLE